jgi:hypothetical protein
MNLKEAAVSALEQERAEFMEKRKQEAIAAVESAFGKEYVERMEYPCPEYSTTFNIDGLEFRYGDCLMTWGNPTLWVKPCAGARFKIVSSLADLARAIESPDMEHYFYAEKPDPYHRTNWLGKLLGKRYT